MSQLVTSPRRGLLSLLASLLLMAGSVHQDVRIAQAVEMPTPARSRARRKRR